MKERPIIFSGEMVRALLEGRKTQTRRIIKPQPVHVSHAFRFKNGVYPVPESQFLEYMANNRCPYGQPGDRLWVRETWARYNIEQNWHDLAYRATTPDDWPVDGLWRPSIHIPRWASRITLEVTSVRVERLQEISEADAIAEGGPPSHPSIDSISRDYGYPDFPRSWFAQLWESINGEGSWSLNPWVWVVTFRRVEP